MDEKTLEIIAGQLRHPEGEHAIAVGEKMNEGNLQINVNTLDTLELKAKDHILEIGMGNGFFVKDIFAAESSLRYFGCDYSEAMVNEASKLNKGLVEDGRATFHLSEAHELPFENEHFDKVFTVNTLYFWEDQRAVLAEIRRVLKPGGQVIISVRPKSSMQQYPFVKYGFNMFTKDEVQTLMSDNQFTVLETIEKNEPEQEIAGTSMPVETLIVRAARS